MSAAEVPDDVQVRDASDHVEVVGLSEDDVKRAIALLRAAGREQLEARAVLRSSVNRAMLEAAVPLVSPATQRQVQRRTANRDALLREHGYETHSSLADSRQSRESSARTWVSRERDKLNLFTIKVGGQTIVPAVQLTPDGHLNEPVAQLVRTLREAGMDGWSLWAWLCSPAGLLSGDVPSEVVTDDPGRALKAARRMAAELETARSGVA